MRLIVFLSLALVASSIAASGEQQQQQQQKRILRRVVKSTPTATNLGRVRLVTVRAAGSTEKGAVSEISSKEAASFGQRSPNETSAQPSSQVTKTKSPVASNTEPSQTATSTTPRASTTTSTTTTTTTTAATPTALPAATVPKASERQQVAPEVELLSSAPSSWQMMTAVEVPTAALIAAGTRPTTQANSDLTSSSSEYSSSQAQNDFLRASSSAKSRQTYSNSRQQSGKTRQQQEQSFFYPQQQQLRQGKTSNYQATKTQWYQPTSTSTTPRPAPLVQEQQYEQYVEQQHVDSAPPGQAEPFAFDFNTQDTSGNGQYRKEESDNNGVVRGSYGFRDASGLYRHVEYVADHNGFRANIKSNEPGLEGGPDSQPASIRLDSGPVPTQSQRFTNNDNNDWTAGPTSGVEKADLALAPPNFESSHKAERIRDNFRS